jgi:hypothetical protein
MELPLTRARHQAIDHEDQQWTWPGFWPPQ